MVSFWPFRLVDQSQGGDSSAAGFEKILSSLATRINKESARDSGFRQHQRRYKVLWTLYTGFAYLIAALILTLVTGLSNWNAAEYTGLAGGPVLIYGVRLAIDTYYNYRISSTQSHLSDLYRQREDAIGKLKAATKYDSTQQLLDKYGGASPKPSPQGSNKRKPSGKNTSGSDAQPQPGGRTGLPPPPTANIPRRQTISPPRTPQTTQPPDFSSLGQQSPPTRAPTQPPESPTAEFAPNAYDNTTPVAPITAAAPEYAHQAGPRWYDRILDVVLGEDETAPKNRIVLICKTCRLVNGQAPPGAKGLEDVGRWRCMGCGNMNGVESEVGKVMRQVQSEAREKSGSGGNEVADGQGAEQELDDEDVEGDDDGDDAALAGDGASEGTTATGMQMRNKARQRKKK